MHCKAHRSFFAVRTNMGAVTIWISHKAAFSGVVSAFNVSSIIIRMRDRTCIQDVNIDIAAIELVFVVAVETLARVDAIKSPRRAYLGFVGFYLRIL